MRRTNPTGKKKLKGVSKPAVETPDVAMPARASLFTIGDQVAHPMFGIGTVSAVSGDKLDIKFQKIGLKTIVDSFVKRG